MVNDISECTPMTEDATDTIERGKRGLTERGVSAVVRVTGESVVGKMQFDRVASGTEGYHVATAETVEEAEALLDEFREGESPRACSGQSALTPRWRSSTASSLSRSAVVPV